MENIMQNIEWIVICLTFAGGLYMYVNHTRKLNKQQEKLNEQDRRLNDQQDQLNEQQQQINEYQLRKNKEEEEESKKAQIECNIIKGKTNKLIVYNKGRSEALNIRVEVLNDQNGSIGFLFEKDFVQFPKLLPHQSFDIPYMLYLGSEPHYTVKLIWDDAFDQERTIEQVVKF